MPDPDAQQTNKVHAVPAYLPKRDPRESWRQSPEVAPPQAPPSFGTLTGGAEGTLARISLASPDRSPSLAGGGPANVNLAPPAFVSSEPWRDKRIGAVAIYCSDGRWGDAIDEFCHRGLGIPAYDRFAVPGGPAWIVEGGQATLARTARDQLGFLVHAHELRRIVLITHWGCAYYGHALGRGPEQCLDTQLQDVSRAAGAVRDWYGRLNVQGFLAARTGGRLTFHALDV